MSLFRLPTAPASIQKGTPLKYLLDVEAVECLAHNIGLIYPSFNQKSFSALALNGIDDLGILQRGQHIASALRAHLPSQYREAIEVLLASLTPANTATESLGLAVFFICHTPVLWRNMGCQRMRMTVKTRLIFPYKLCRR